MKKNIFYLLLAVLLVISCKKDPEIGKWSDNIKLSQKTASFNSSNTSLVITSETTGWWLNGITYNQKSIDLTNVEKTAQNFVVTAPDFQVERKGGNKIVITMNQNTTNADRLLSVSLQHGNYFDGIEIRQSK
ncbi:hypothetical protein ACS5PU_22655 [Pedobacter sp. GSP4]|uniref:hypothetical protein n=1 Tax=Pedobacter sp. GSP4 TaxID=3453716 RepID=UPI003EED3492